MTNRQIRYWQVWAAAAALIVLTSCPDSQAGMLEWNKPIKVSGPDIEAVLDIPAKEIRINRLAIEKDLPTGRLQHKLPQPYTLRLNPAPDIRMVGVTTFTASDWFDGIGVKLQMDLSYSSSLDKWRGGINITSQHEETSLHYSAQQLKVSQ